MKRAGTVGILYFMVHFLLEVVSFYVLTSYIQSPFVWVLFLAYDFAAFVPQGFFGWLRDIGVSINFALAGTALTASALTLMLFDHNPFLIIAVLSLGNCMVHIHGAEITLRSSPGKITPSAVFVSGGSFGVIIGRLLSTFGVTVPWILAVNVIMVVPVIIAEQLGDPHGGNNLKKFNFSNPKLSAASVIVLASAVVAVRAYMGYGIPTIWNKTVLQNVALYFSMGLGKALGGVLTDTIGIRKTALISTLGSLPFLILGADTMWVSLIGIAVFSMTMAVSLALIVSRLQTLPGVAFGFTTLGLFMGTVPIFFVRIESVWLNCVIISALTVLCAVVLTVICGKRQAKTKKE